MIDLLTAAGVLGYSAVKDLAAEIGRRRRIWGDRKIADHCANVATYAYDAAVTRTLVDYYEMDAPRMTFSGIER